VGAVLGFFRCFDSPCVRQHVPNSTSLVFGVNTSILVHNFLGWKNVTKGLFKLYQKMNVSYLESKKTCPSIQAPSSFPLQLKNVNMEKVIHKFQKTDKKPTGLSALAPAPYGQFKPARVKIANVPWSSPKMNWEFKLTNYEHRPKKTNTSSEVLVAYFRTYHKLKSLRLKTLKPQCLLVLSQ
jgi:hypothetical protein